ncbi:intradiol ring-cleavage dioxygenase [Panaeolus papilionaceus]|nr:intradiol ring-cleavage dioxygenase [Panaeolus papilionaceus]
MQSILNAANAARKHGIDLSTLPVNQNMTSESITEDVIAMNANCPDERARFIFKSLVTHLHNFVREMAITPEEWELAIKFLTETGQKCDDTRQEFILLSDTLGVSALVGSINSATPPDATESSVLGPFYTDKTHHLEKGSSIASEGKGDYMYVEGTVKDLEGNPIANAVIDTWETDGQGLYDVQLGLSEPECRGRFLSAEDGSYAFRAVVPIAYPIPADGPVAKMMANLGRHIIRPAHLHMHIEAPGFQTLTTALYFKGDPYVNSDPVFGVKSSLIVEPTTITDGAVTKARGFKDAKPHLHVRHDFVLPTVEQAEAARLEKLASAKA